MRKLWRSRLLVGSGKYKDLQQTREATDAAEAEIITVAIRRVKRASTIVFGMPNPGPTGGGSGTVDTIVTGLSEQMKLGNSLLAISPSDGRRGSPESSGRPQGPGRPARCGPR